MDTKSDTELNKVDSLKELSQFLDIKSRLDLKATATQHILSITGSSEGRELLLSAPEILRQLIILLQDKTLAIAKDASMALINISGDESGASALLIISESSKLSKSDLETDDLVYLCLKNILDKDCKLADPCCMILSNMTRPHHLVERIFTLIDKSSFDWYSILKAFTTNNYNTTGAKLHYIGPVLSNLSQVKKMRQLLADRDKWVLQQILPFVQYKDSIVRRGGIVGTLKNCCFDIENHEWLLGPDADILSYLLLPLAGPEEFSDEDNEKLPIDLQYLPETKTRESDPDIKIILLEALEQLCATKFGREFLREKNTYIILRELHKCEKDKDVLLACENVVDILIKTEEEIGHDNLKDLEVPEEYKEKFEAMNKEFSNDSK